MSRFSLWEYEKQGPNVQLIPLIDILFFVLILFMSLYIFNQQETETRISVPQSRISAEAAKSPGQIVINITRQGRFIVAQQEMNAAALEEMLRKVADMFPNQSVVIRADEDAYHKYVIAALDACTRVGLWDISFSVGQGEK